MTTMHSTPETVRSPGPVVLSCDAVQHPTDTRSSARIEDFASAYLSRRYRLPLPLARVVAGLAGIGERVG